jgi:ribosomal protein L11 methyltransferase
MSDAPYREGVFRVSAEIADVWTGFCFEQDAAGCEVLNEEGAEHLLRVFLTESERDLGLWPAAFRAAYPLVEGYVELVEQHVRESENWRETWHSFFTPLTIGRTLQIAPVWHKAPLDPNRHTLWLEPGQAFGTGAHISTRLALETLELVILQEEHKPQRLIDVGTGSGILGLAACALGVMEIVGCDLDPVVIPEAQRNFELHQWGDRFCGVTGTAAALQEPAPLVISNMLLRELLPSVPDLARLLAPQGSLICSGLLCEQEPELAAALSAHGLQICATTVAEGWVALVFREEGAF